MTWRFGGRRCEDPMRAHTGAERRESAKPRHALYARIHEPPEFGAARRHGVYGSLLTQLKQLAMGGRTSCKGATLGGASYFNEFSTRALAPRLISAIFTAAAALETGHHNVSYVPRDFLNPNMKETYRKQGWKINDPDRCNKYIFSRKLDTKCMSSPAAGFLIPLLVTGTASTGTRAVAHFFTAMGIDVGHERYGHQAVVSWTHAVNEKSLGVSYPFSPERTKWWQSHHVANHYGSENLIKPRFASVVHLTRCPLRVITSLLRPHAPIIRFVDFATAYPSITSPCGATYDCETDLAERIGWALSTYVAWNEHIERYADERVRIEDLFSGSGLGRTKATRLCELALKDDPRSTVLRPCAKRVATAFNTSASAGRGDALLFDHFARTLLLKHPLNYGRVSTADSMPGLSDSSKARMLSVKHLAEATFSPGVDGNATLDAFLKMGARYGYDHECTHGNMHREADLFWSSRKRQLVLQKPLVQALPAESVTKEGIEKCLTKASDAECPLIEAPCPSTPAPRECLRASVPFRTPYRRLKCCFRCCVLHWLETTRLADNIRYQSAHIDEKPESLGSFSHNPDSGDMGLDPVSNLLVHPHAFGAIADVRLHAMTGCFVAPAAAAGASRLESLNATIASLYHYTPDAQMLPPDGAHVSGRRQSWEKDRAKFKCVQLLRRSKRIIVDVFDPKKWLPGLHLGDRLSLFLANNIDNEKPDYNLDRYTKTGKVQERVIGVRAPTLWQALLEHPDLEHNFPASVRDRLLLCCCMNVDGKHKGRMEHTKLLALHPEFDCPLNQEYRFHHIGRPKKTDPGAHEIENEVYLMVRNRYGNQQQMSGSFDTHMPILMMTSKFVYSPNGVGEQCYREYEALISGAIPVLDETSFKYRHELLGKLPTVRISNWSSVTPDFLRSKWHEMEQRSYDVSILYLPYWYDQVLTAMGNV